MTPIRYSQEAGIRNAHVMKVGLAGGTLNFKDQELTLYRNGIPEQVWMDLDYSPVLDEGGTPAGVIAIVVETTERVLAGRLREQVVVALRESEERYRSLFESMDEGFCIIESISAADGQLTDFRYVAVNPAFAISTGIEGVLGKTLREVLPLAEVQGWIDIYDHVVATGEPIKFERGLLMQGRVLELYAFRVTEPRQHSRVGFIFSDITARKGAEASCASGTPYGLAVG